MPQGDCNIAVGCWILFSSTGFASGIWAATSCVCYRAGAGGTDRSASLGQIAAPAVLLRLCHIPSPVGLPGAGWVWVGPPSCSVGGEDSPRRSPWRYPQAAVLPSVLYGWHGASSVAHLVAVALQKIHCSY